MTSSYEASNDVGGCVSEERKPWAIVCHKPGRFGGVIAGDDTFKPGEIAKFCGDFAASGYTITPVYDRAEYESLLDSLKAKTP